jgi:hypothetical protein
VKENVEIGVCLVAAVAVTFYLADLFRHGDRVPSNSRLKLWVGITLAVGLAVAWTNIGK